MIRPLLSALALSALAPAAMAADALTGAVEKQPLNVSAIVMFVIFVAFPPCLPPCASKRNNTTPD